MKILLTGCTGFIGKHLSEALISSGIALSAIVEAASERDDLESKGIGCFVDCERATSSMLQFFNDNRFDGVIHLASCFLVEHKPEDVSGLISTNLLFSTRVLEAAVQSNVRWFINTGTFWQHFNNNDYSPVNLYAATKQAFQTIAQYYIEISEINFVTIKLNDTYGKGDTRPKLFNLWLNAIKNKQRLDMSPGEQLIDIVHVRDVVSAYLKMIELIKNDSMRSFCGKSYSVTSGNPVRLKDLAKIFEEFSDRKLDINWGGRAYRKREVMMPWSKGEMVPGWEPKLKITDGIRDFLNNK